MVTLVKEKSNYLYKESCGFKIFYKNKNRKTFLLNDMSAHHNSNHFAFTTGAAGYLVRPTRIALKKSRYVDLINTNDSPQP